MSLLIRPGVRTCSEDAIYKILILFFVCFLAITAKKEEDDEDMEDLQRWAMEAN